MSEIEKLREELASHCACLHDGRGELVSECQTHREMRERLEAYDGVLRGLAGYLGAGGFNSAGLIDPKVADEKIRWGIEHLPVVDSDLRAALGALCDVHTRDAEHYVWEVVMGAVPRGYPTPSLYVEAWRQVRKAIGRAVD